MNNQKTPTDFLWVPEECGHSVFLGGEHEYRQIRERAELLKRKGDFRSELEEIKDRLGDDFFELYSMDLELLWKQSSDNILLKRDFPKVRIVQTDRKIQNHEYLSEFVERVELEHNRSIYLFNGICENKNCPYRKVDRDSYFDDLDLNSVPIPSNVDITSTRTLIRIKLCVFEKYMNKWSDFCKKWFLDEFWDGDLSCLYRYMSPLLELKENKKDPRFPLSINIGPLTKIDDIKRSWNDIKRILAGQFERQPERASNKFERTLCWYDLKRHGLTPKDIANIWIEQCPEDIDLLVMRKLKTNKENKDTIGGNDEQGLLAEIRDDPEMKDLKICFESERKNYLEYPNDSLVHLIRNSIKNMERRIENFSSTRSRFKIIK